MKFSPHSNTASRRVKGGRAGFTLMEVMITVALMSMVIAAVLSAQFMGLRQDQLLESKAGIDDHSRQAISQLLYDIRAAKGYNIGSGNNGTNFVAVTNGASMIGPALFLYTSVQFTNQTVITTNYTLYYFDTSNIANSDGILWRTTSTATNSTVVASNLINTFNFTNENYTGAVQTVRTYKGIIHTTLQFRQFQYPLTAVGTNGIFDYYRIDCRATPHLPDGP